MAEVTPGKKTSEWKAWIVAVCGALALAMGSILATGLIGDTAGFGAFEALTLAVTVLAGVGGVTIPTTGYIKGRAAVKSEQLRTEAVKAAPADPPKAV